jgi:hypothetical protein
MATSSPVTQFPRLNCSCGKATDISGRRVGDSLACSGCGQLRVIIRSKVTGDLPAAVEAGALTAVERDEVEATLRRIKLRRVGRATQHVDLYPNWAVFVAGVQFYLSGFLAGQNLIALGQEARGKRVQVTSVILYLVLGAGLLALHYGAGAWLPRVALLPALLIPLGFASYYVSIQAAPSAAAREAGAGNASVVLPLLLGLILAIAQAFAVWFLELQLNPWG